MTDPTADPSALGDLPDPSDPSVADDAPPVPAQPAWRRRAGVALMVLVLLALAAAVLRDREAFGSTLQRVGPAGIGLSAGAALLGVLANGLSWHRVMGGVGISLSRSDALRVYFVSQLGKYLPGSVWPIVLQMEAARQRGASRRTMLAGNLVNLAMGLATGLVLAAATLPFASPEALRRYWWALAAAPLVVVVALPATLPRLLDRVLRLLHREPLGVTLAPRAALGAAGWSLASWVLLGLHLTVLVAAAGASWSAGLVLLCVGGFGLAVTAGVLFVPSPAGAGVREVALGLVLAAVLRSGEVVVVVVASRLVLVLADAVLAGAAGLVGSARSRHHRTTGR